MCFLHSTLEQICRSRASPKQAGTASALNVNFTHLGQGWNVSLGEELDKSNLWYHPGVAKRTGAADTQLFGKEPEAKGFDTSTFM